MKMVDSTSKSVADQPALADDRIATQLVAIWKEILGLDSVDVSQNYFDLGGDSALAVQLFARIEKAFHVKLPLATLFEAPTIKELAAVVHEGVVESGWSSLVEIQPTGTRPAFFCVHGAGGNVLIYRELSQSLGSDQPFYGLQAQGLDGSRPPLTKIEEMAALYVKEIRKAQPHGPYLLGGYCMGGTIAFEMAQKLRAQGERVALLALFDTMDWSKIKLPSLWDKLGFWLERLRFHAANFFLLDTAGKTKFVSEKIQALRNRLPVWRGMLLTGAGGRSNSATDESRLLGQIWRANDRAAVSYCPEPYPARITDFRPMKQYRMYDKPEAKWDRLAQGGQEIVVLPVYPAGMLVEPFVKRLAIALRKAIEEAMRNDSSSSVEPAHSVSGLPLTR
jgi:phthiocerol/phenolphthiocerol synthesis type-I polyketide synthase E